MGSQAGSTLDFLGGNAKRVPSVFFRKNEDAGLTRPISYMSHPVAPVAYQVILEPGIGQFREFESPRVHTRLSSWGLFLVHKLTCGKNRERELATLDEKSTSSGIAEPYAR